MMMRSQPDDEKLELHLETAESAATAKQSIALRDLYADDLQIAVPQGWFHGGDVDGSSDCHLVCPQCGTLAPLTEASQLKRFRAKLGAEWKSREHSLVEIGVGRSGCCGWLIGQLLPLIFGSLYESGWCQDVDFLIALATLVLDESRRGEDGLQGEAPKWSATSFGMP